MTKLKELRKAAGLTRVQLSDRTGIPIRTLEAYEQGLRPLTGAGIEKIMKMSNVLSVDPYDLTEKKQ